MYYSYKKRVLQLLNSTGLKSGLCVTIQSEVFPILALQRSRSLHTRTHTQSNSLASKNHSLLFPTKQHVCCHLILWALTSCCSLSGRCVRRRSFRCVNVTAKVCLILINTSAYDELLWSDTITHTVKTQFMYKYTVQNTLYTAFETLQYQTAEPCPSQTLPLMIPTLFPIFQLHTPSNLYF